VLGFGATFHFARRTPGTPASIRPCADHPTRRVAPFTQVRRRTSRKPPVSMPRT
jgi:hypothetical protein